MRALLPILGLSLLLTGCKQSIGLLAFVKDNDIYFDSPQLKAECSEKTSIYSLQVLQAVDCQDNCERWNVSRDGIVEDQLPIRYGVSLSDSNIRTAPQLLIPGDYNIGADAVCYSDGGDREVKVLTGRFRLNIDDGKKSVVNITSDGKVVSVTDMD